jgi:DNA repair protein RecN (Recombination protein N)
MLAALKIRDLVLIEDVELEFAPGLNVLTGETGAGKSILLDALGLATGARAGGRSTVRAGAQQGSAVAIFELPASHSARALLSANAIRPEGETFLRRAITSDARTRAFVNDEPVGIGLLRNIGVLLVEIHGQTDDRGLFDTATHRKLLDAFAGNESLVREVAERFGDFQKTRGHAEELRGIAEKAGGELEFLRYTVDELSALSPEPGEEAKLAAERVFLMNASRIAEDISSVLNSLGGEQGAEQSLAAALRRMSRMRDEARQRVSTAERVLEQAFALTEEARRELEALLSGLDMDPHALEEKEERLFALRAAARKHGVQADELSNVLQEARVKLQSVSDCGENLRKAEADVTRAREAFVLAARQLSETRKEAARGLEAAVAGEFAPLKLSHAKFRVALEPLHEADAGINGLERVAFEVATVDRAPFGPLAKIASGGELARFSLALKVALSEASPPAALVFDEVDRGVGGAVADAVGERLQRLAKSTQVLLVTHSPQVAARAERHFRIMRKRDRTQVEVLSAEQRVEEIARMLSGAAVTEEARAAARRLLTEAQSPPKKMRKRA